MKTIGVRKLRTSGDALKKLLAQEGEVLLTHRGKPFARVLPHVPNQMPDLRAFRARQKPQAVPSSVYIRQDRDDRSTPTSSTEIQ